MCENCETARKIQTDVALIAGRLSKSKGQGEPQLVKEHLNNVVLIVLAGLLAEKIEQFSHQDKGDLNGQ
ncbi:hypothetical protein HY572_00995 [Candidatus Micrarchaeota archaeon]|nr:hypothetical protein [Candidatus Micrarchaeota archaeon]